MNISPLSPPPAPRDDTIVETLHGLQVADPFRPLEDIDSAATLAFVDGQNARVKDFIGQNSAAHAAATAWFEKAMNYDVEGVASRYGDYFFSYAKAGLANQSVYLVREGSRDAAPRVLIDPNHLSENGTLALSNVWPSPDGRKVAWLAAAQGSDKQTLHIRDTVTGKDLPDVITGLRNGHMAWDADGLGFTYTLAVDANDKPDVKSLQSVVFHHVIGQSQAQDTVIFRDKTGLEQFAASAWHLEPEDSRTFVSVHVGTFPESGLYWRDSGETDWHEIIAPKIADISPFYREGDMLYATTNLGAPRNRIVKIDLNNPASENWQTVVAESSNKTVTLTNAFVSNGILFTQSKFEGVDRLERRDLASGALRGIVKTPAASEISVGQVRPQDSSFMVVVDNYLSSAEHYRYDIASDSLTLTRPSLAPVSLKDIAVVERLYATSKDGTQVPMWVIRPKTMPKDGKNATLLYGYGGFNVSLDPGFSSGIAHFVSQGGVYVVANLRGGGEFGHDWYDAGRLHNKQNVFDDFAACAEKLIADNITTPKRLVIEGGSNGGLLTAVAMIQRPELYGAVISHVPVIDMLRFHKFTIGKYWVSDYGNPDDAADFATVMTYSPLHTIKDGAHYPPIMITTGDHDDRVWPAHAYKFAATLQDRSSPDNIVLLRVEKDAGHGAGKPTSKIITEKADMIAFIEKVIGPIARPEQHPKPSPNSNYCPPAI